MLNVETIFLKGVVDPDFVHEESEAQGSPDLARVPRLRMLCTRTRLPALKKDLSTELLNN